MVAPKSPAGHGTGEISPPDYIVGSLPLLCYLTFNSLRIRLVLSNVARFGSRNSDPETK